jgi:hypothetical protein
MSLLLVGEGWGCSPAHRRELSYAQIALKPIAVASRPGCTSGRVVGVGKAKLVRVLACAECRLTSVWIRSPSPMSSGFKIGQVSFNSLAPNSPIPRPRCSCSCMSCADHRNRIDDDNAAMRRPSPPLGIASNLQRPTWPEHGRPQQGNHVTKGLAFRRCATHHEVSHNIVQRINSHMPQRYAR